jgi:hypothetical protein
MTTHLESGVIFYAKSALNGFETLDAETAAENAKSDLEAILRLLGADNALGILLVEPVKSVRDDPSPIRKG